MRPRDMRLDKDGSGKGVQKKQKEGQAWYEEDLKGEGRVSAPD